MKVQNPKFSSDSVWGLPLWWQINKYLKQTNLMVTLPESHSRVALPVHSLSMQVITTLFCMVMIWSLWYKVICFRSITLSLSIMQLSMQVMLTPFCVIYHIAMRGVLCFTKLTKFITLSRSNEQWLVTICPMFSFSPCKNVQQMFSKECWASPPCVWGEGVHGNIRSFITTLGWKYYSIHSIMTIWS